MRWSEESDGCTERISEIVQKILEAGKQIGRAEREAEIKAERRQKDAERKARSRKNVSRDLGEDVTGHSGECHVTFVPEKQCSKIQEVGNNEAFRDMIDAAILDGEQSIKALIDSAFIEGKEEGTKEAEQERKRKESADRNNRRIAKKGQLSADVSADMSPDNSSGSPSFSPPFFPPSFSPSNPFLTPPYNPPTFPPPRAVNADALTYAPEGRRDSGDRVRSERGRGSLAQDGGKTADLFAEFWNRYPRKQHKQEAWREWCRLAPDAETTDLIARAVETRKQSRLWQEDGGRYVPKPDKFLRGRQWEDELLEVDKPQEYSGDGASGTFDTNDFFRAAVEKATGDTEK
jgi:hypothetical protein